LIDESMVAQTSCAPTGNYNIGHIRQASGYTAMHSCSPIWLCR